MANNYPLGFYFQLSFKGQDAAFQEVSGITKEMTVEEVVCGGENRFKYRLPNVVTSQNLVLKRALIPDGSELADWCAATMDDDLAYAIETHDISVSLLDKDGDVSIMWTFYKAYPIKYSISDLKSQENEIVMESIEFAYTYFEITSDDSFANLFN